MWQDIIETTVPIRTNCLLKRHFCMYFFATFNLVVSNSATDCLEHSSLNIFRVNITHLLNGLWAAELVLSHKKEHTQLECGAMPNIMAALLNIGGALCSTTQSLADAHYQSTAQ